MSPCDSGSFLVSVSFWSAATRRALPLLWPLLLAACGDAGSDGLTDGIAGMGGNPAAGSGGAPDGGGTAGIGGTAGVGGSPATPVGDGGVGECNASVVESTPISATHRTQCSALSYSTNPPSGGDHYAIWAAYQSYDFALPAGYLVHSLEHGAVVFWYNCPDGCPDEVAQVEEFIAALPQDPLCASAGVPRRAVLVPSPELGSRWAASAWGFALTADCFDAQAFGAFYEEHYGRGPEELCNPPAMAITADPCL
jgi:uncharacterized protein DUF3105